MNSEPRPWLSGHPQFLLERTTMPADANRVQAIFLRAVDAADPAAREQVLQNECGADAELRERVEALLHGHDASGGFLDRPPVAPITTVDEPRLTEGPGTRIGPYKLLQQLGEGGMGVVFLAEQVEPVQRKVALKVIKPGMDTNQVVARFEAERQALAMMDHPNIAKVLDAGATESGRPFFVMELVKGLPITKYCDQEHMTPQERLHLFVPICQAVQHAHQKGIIHRDLKPSNILIALYDGRPMPKVIDFGVAKATITKLTDRTLFTEVGHAIGTWEYMAPEQAELNNLDIDTRADIYALGATLYELLAGSPPFSKAQLRNAAFEEMLRLIREVEPPKPSTKISASDELPSLAAKRKLEPARLSRLMRGDLDWIVMKCLEKERGRRYETANGLALDVQRYLADEPVLASPPSAAYRLRKFARRHKGKLLTATLVGLVLSIAAGSLGWALWDRAEQRTINRTEKIVQAKQNRAIAEASLARLDDLYKQFLWDEAEALLDGAEKLVGPDGDPELLERIAKAKRKTRLFHDLDQAQLKMATSVEGRAFDHAGASAQYAKAFRDFGLDVHRGQKEALAARIREQEPIVREALLVALDAWANCDHTAFGGVLLELAAVDEDSWRQGLRKAAVARDRAALLRLAEQARRLPLAPASIGLLAMNLRFTDRLDDAVALLRWARVRHPADFWIAFDLGNYLRINKVAPFEFVFQLNSYFSASKLAPGDREEQIGCYRVAVALRPQCAAAHNNLGAALAEKKELDDAIAEFKKAIEIDAMHDSAHFNLGVALAEKYQFDDAIAEFKLVIEMHPKYIMAHYGLGNALAAKKQLDDAIAEFKKAIEMDPKFPLAHSGLGTALVEKNEFDDAIAEFRTAIKIDPKDAPAHSGLGNAFHGKRQFGDAIAEYKKAIDLDPNFAVAYSNLGNVLREKKQLDDAITACKRAIDLNPKLAVAHNNLGAALAEKKQLDAAIAEYKIAIAIHPKYAAAHHSLGMALLDKDQPDDAIAELRKAIEIDPKHAPAHNGLGVFLYRQKQLDDAIAEFNQAIQIDPKYVPAHNNLGNALADKNQWDEAIVEYKKAIDLDPEAAEPHSGLGNALVLKNPGNALVDKKQLDDAIAELKKAIEIDPKHAPAHSGLGNAFFRKGQLDDAIAEYKIAIELDPKNALAYYNLGIALADKKLLDDAIAAYKKAVEINPKLRNAYFNLGNALVGKRQFNDAIAAFQKTVEIDPKYAKGHASLGQVHLYMGHLAQAKASSENALKLMADNDPFRPIVLGQLERCNFRIALEDVLAGRAKPADSRGWLALIQMCHNRQRNAAAAKLSASAFAADPKLADDMKLQHRYNAACYAALAAAGKGIDAGELDDKERAHFRQQALEWLRADLTHWTLQATSDKPEERNLAQQRMKHWQEDSDLTGVRDKDALAKLPAEERVAWEKLWAEVAALLKKAESGK
jgi:tetratricopeptide (TPR) repeat protein/serine/threonine protein kinase